MLEKGLEKVERLLRGGGAKMRGGQTGLSWVIARDYIDHLPQPPGAPVHAFAQCETRAAPGTRERACSIHASCRLLVATCIVPSSSRLPEKVCPGAQASVAAGMAPTWSEAVHGDEHHGLAVRFKGLCLRHQRGEVHSAHADQLAVALQDFAAVRACHDAVARACRLPRAHDDLRDRRLAAQSNTMV